MTARSTDKPRTIKKGLHIIRIFPADTRILWCHPGTTNGRGMCGEKEDHCEALFDWSMKPWDRFFTSINPLTVENTCLACKCGYHIFVTRSSIRVAVAPRIISQTKGWVYKYEDPWNNRRKSDDPWMKKMQPSKDRTAVKKTVKKV